MPCSSPGSSRWPHVPIAWSIYLADPGKKSGVLQQKVPQSINKDPFIAGIRPFRPKDRNPSSQDPILIFSSSAYASSHDSKELIIPSHKCDDDERTLEAQSGSVYLQLNGKRVESKKLSTVAEGDEQVQTITPLDKEKLCIF